MSLAKVNLHPTTIRLIKKNHPWIIKDEFTQRFPRETILIGVEDKSKPIALLLHDPEHPRVKARVWQRAPEEFPNIPEFRAEATKRLEAAISRREDLKSLKNRDNYYLCFGESDQLPGLHVLKLGNVIVVQYIAFVWQEHEKAILKCLKAHFADSSIYVQTRESNSPYKHKHGAQQDQFEITEYDCKMQIDLTVGQDFGIYTDMSAIRREFKHILTEKKNVLNLFSYTGAYSLQALRQGARTTSIDLSKKYMNWLEKNISLNDFSGEHDSIVAPVDRMLKKFNENDRKFDLIISDPPSISSNGKKRTNSLDFYKQNLGALYNVLEDGGHLLLFCNTHKMTRKKFRALIDQTLKENGLHVKFKIIDEYRMKEDCNLISGFPEGDYLKGYLLEKMKG